jgi:hypothetical protein
MIYIMDASAMLAFLRDEAGADVIETYLLEPGSQKFNAERSGHGARFKAPNALMQDLTPYL